MGEEKKELAFRYGVYWKRDDGELEPYCPACKNPLNYKREGDVQFFTEGSCVHCKKVSPVHDDEGNDITIKDAIGLMRAVKHATNKGVSSGRTYNPGFWADQHEGECKRRKSEKMEEEETKSIGNGIIICKLNDILCEVDAIKAGITESGVDAKERANYILTEIIGRNGHIDGRIIDLSQALERAIKENKAMHSTKEGGNIGGVLALCGFAIIGSVVTLVVQSFLN